MDIVQREIIFNVMKRDELPVYYIYSADGKSLYASQENSSMPIDQVIDQLDTDLSSCLGRYVIVEARKNNTEEQGRGGDIRNRKIYRYKVSTEQRQQLQGSQGLGGFQDQNNFSFQLMQQVADMRTEMSKQQFEFEKKELLRELREVKEEAKNPMIDQVITGFLSQYQKMQSPHAAPIAGASPDDTQNVTDVKARAKSCMIMMRKIDPTFEKFEKILQFATANPDQFNLLVSHIENSNNG